MGGLDVCIRYPTRMCDFNDLGVLTVTDASFAGEPGMKSQQGRMHFLCLSSQVRDPKCEQFTVLPISFASTSSSVCAARRSRQKRIPYSRELSRGPHQRSTGRAVRMRSTWRVLARPVKAQGTSPASHRLPITPLTCFSPTADHSMIT